MSKPTTDGLKVIARNKKARHDYAIEETVEAGLELMGSEVKSLRDGRANLSDSYALPENGQIFLHHLNISPYEAASTLGHTPLRTRRLLLKRREIDRLTQKVAERGYALIPLQLHFRNGWAKVDIGLAKGKTNVDRRQDLKERETKREIERELRSRRR